MPPETEPNNDEWEYEYDQNANEVFLVDLDLTTLHRTFKSTATDRGKRLNDLPDKKSNKKQKVSKSNQPKTISKDASLQQASEGTGDGATDEHINQEYGIQFLDLHTGNPIVSYKGEVFSCTWTDMIGTNMFFSQPKETPLYDPEISTADFDMIGTSRIKLVGNPIKVTPTSQAVATSGANAKSQQEPFDVPDKPGKSLGSIRRTNAKVNADLRKQANFLEQLMNIKKDRGEQDNVHVVMNSKISKAVAAGKLKFNTQRRGREIDRLNRRVVRGDAEALRKLEQIYSGRDEDSEDDASPAEGVNEDTINASNQLDQIEDSDGEPDVPDTQPRMISTASSSSGPVTNVVLLNTSNDNG